jgi:hypothetical protein
MIRRPCKRSWTSQAFMDNERDTLAVREKIDAMLLKAHVPRE